MLKHKVAARWPSGKVMLAKMTEEGSNVEAVGRRLIIEGDDIIPVSGDALETFDYLIDEPARGRGVSGMMRQL